MTLLLCMSFQAFAIKTGLDEDQSMSLNLEQEERIVGMIKDRSGEPLPGVNVVIKGTAIGVVSGLDGR
jgi:hypothetical protein